MQEKPMFKGSPLNFTLPERGFYPLFFMVISQQHSQQTNEAGYANRT